MGLGALLLPSKNTNDSLYEDASSCEIAVSKLRWKCTTKNDAHGVIWNLGGILRGYTTRGSTFFNTVNTYCGGMAIVRAWSRERGAGSGDFLF
jgi:hypothetical protein